jgi:phosphoadenosine phosphosulfate reductase
LSGRAPLAARNSTARPRPFHDQDAGPANGAHANGNGADASGERPKANGGAWNGNGRPARPPTIAGEVVDPAAVAAEVEPLSARESIAWAIERFHPALRFAVSFQRTSSVIIDLAHSLEPGAAFFYLDTDLLFEETYATRDALLERYGMNLRRHAGISLEEQAEREGASLWRRHPDACCGIRKVEPMRAALSEAECWVSGIRRVDFEARAGAARFGWDKRFGLWKLNPLVDWTDEQVAKHIRENQVPYNPLHDQGYPSIGCTHCTVRPTGVDARSGRWSGFAKTECGINE